MTPQKKTVQILRDLPILASSASALEGIDLKIEEVPGGLTWHPPGKDQVAIVVHGRLCHVNVERSREKIVRVFTRGQTVSVNTNSRLEEPTTVLRAAVDTTLVLVSSSDLDGLEAATQADEKTPRSLQMALESLLDLEETAADEFAAEISAELEWVQLNGGEYLFRQGDPGDALFVLDSGRLCILLERGGATRVLDHLGRGQVVGEMALLSNEPRSAGVLALRDCKLLRISKPLFERVIKRHPEFSSRITQALVHRLRSTSRDRGLPARSRFHTIALIPLTSDTPIAELTGAMGQALTRFGAVDSVTSDRVHRDLGLAPGYVEDDAVRSRVVTYLDRLERESEYVVLEADASGTWTDQCLRHADVVLVIGHGGPPDPRALQNLEVISEKRRRLARLELILVHPSGTGMPAGSAGWIRNHGERISAHHHVRRERLGDVDRVARHLVGRSIALVLSGGGARGFAHLGVFRAFEDLGIPVDHVGGASMGSIMGGQIAIGRHDATDLIRLTRELFSSRGAAREYTIPVAGLVPGNRALRLFQEAFGDPDIEDLWRPFFCVACDLTSSREVVYRSGRLWGRIRASVAIPGVWVPAVENGSVLVDGGIINNLPVDVMRQFAAGPIIASNTVREKNLSVPGNLESYPSNLRLVLRAFRRGQGEGRVPHMGDILLRSLLCASMRHAQQMQDKASLCLKVPVEQYGMLQFGSIDNIVETGYRYAREHLKVWLESDAGKSALP